MHNQWILLWFVTVICIVHGRSLGWFLDDDSDDQLETQSNYNNDQDGLVLFARLQTPLNDVDSDDSDYDSADTLPMNIRNYFVDGDDDDDEDDDDDDEDEDEDEDERIWNETDEYTQLRQMFQDESTADNAVQQVDDEQTAIGTDSETDEYLY
jgi:hypothetical protein